MKIHKETQKYNRIEAFGLLALFILLAVILFIKLAFIAPEMSVSMLLIDLSVLLVASGMLYVLLKTSLDISISKSSIKYKYKMASLFTQKEKIKWKDVEEIKVIETSSGSSFSGYGVHFSMIDRRISFNGYNGLYLTLKNGSQIFLGSQNLDAVRSALSNLDSQEAH